MRHFFEYTEMMLAGSILLNPLSISQPILKLKQRHSLKMAYIASDKR